MELVICIPPCGRCGFDLILCGEYEGNQILRCIRCGKTYIVEVCFIALQDNIQESEVKPIIH